MALLRRLRRLLAKRRMEDEMHDELRAHLELIGMSIGLRVE